MSQPSEKRVRCLEKGMDDYVSKPINSGELLQVVDDTIIRMRNNAKENQP
ncbi:MAG: hypothetical protein ABIJ35_03545 [Acidobacteriota bacterium]